MNNLMELETNWTTENNMSIARIILVCFSTFLISILHAYTPNIKVNIMKPNIDRMKLKTLIDYWNYGESFSSLSCIIQGI